MVRTCLFVIRLSTRLLEASLLARLRRRPRERAYVRVYRRYVPAVYPYPLGDALDA